MGKDDTCLEKTIEDDIARLFAKAEKRVEAGRDPREATWQATLELFFVIMTDNLADNAGRILPLRLETDEESAFYTFVDGKADLPPDTHALFISPSAFESLALPEQVRAAAFGPTPSEPYWLLVSDTRDHDKILQTTLPGATRIGTDIFEDGNHLADYAYHTIDACADDLAHLIWTYFAPKTAWSEDRVAEYTENWAAKLIYNRESSVHAEHSYLHHPELLGIGFLEALFRTVGAVIPNEVESLENAVLITNDLNRIMEEDIPEVTKQGVLDGDERECRELFDRLSVEIDTFLNAVEDAGVDIPQRTPGNREYEDGFNTVTRGVYEKITGCPCPDSICVEWERSVEE